MSPLFVGTNIIFLRQAVCSEYLMFLEKVRFPFSQDLATFKFPPKKFQITLWATSWTDFRFVSCYNIQIGLSFNLAPIFTPSDLYFMIILTLKHIFFCFLFVKKKLHFRNVTIMNPKIMRFDYFLFLNGRARYYLSLERYFKEIGLSVRKLDQIYEKIFSLCVFAHFLTPTKWHNWS